MEINSNLYTAYNSIQNRMEETAKNISEGKDLTDNLVELRNQENQSKAVTKAIEAEKDRLGNFLDVMA
jgi:site-specific DNA-adenine methylase